MSSKKYITCGVSEYIPYDVQLFIWNAVDAMTTPKDYLQVFNLSIENDIQVIVHSSEVPEYHQKYTLTDITEPVTAKLYVIEENDYSTMLLAEEY